MQYDFPRELILKLKEQDIDIAIETAGAVSTERFMDIVSLVDFVYIDCKHHNSAKHQKGTAMPNEGIVSNIKWLANCGIYN